MAETHWLEIEGRHYEIRLHDGWRRGCAAVARLEGRIVAVGRGPFKEAALADLLEQIQPPPESPSPPGRGSGWGRPGGLGPSRARSPGRRGRAPRPTLL